jgi:uncharacterized BrkB/YihY/UPF0761 family membrane protein
VRAWAAFVGAGLVFAAVLVSRVSAEHINVPNRDYWTAPERLPRLRRRLSTDLLVIGALTFLLLAAAFALTGRAAVEDAPLSPWAYVVVGAYLVAVGGYCVHIVRRRYQPPAD